MKKNIFLFAMIFLFSFAFGEKINTARLVGMDNFRDVAGITEAYKVQDGKTLRQNVFYRSNFINPQKNDMKILENLNLALVIDLRTPDEIKKEPDALPAGVKYININVEGSEKVSMPNAKSQDDVRKYLEDMNRKFVNNSQVREKFKEVFTLLAETNGVVLFHCTAGKDRTGFVAAILQLNAGASEKDVMDNYMATNEYTVENQKRLNEMFEKEYGKEFAKLFAPALGVEISFLQAGLDEIKKQYKDVNNYLTKGLGLSEKQVEKLKRKFIVNK